MGKLTDFVAQKPRPLPVIVLADVSGSMSSGGKIETLNRSIKDMLESFAEVDEVRSEISFALIAFGNGKAELHVPFTPASEVVWKDLKAGGRTPMGAAFSKLKGLLEDHQIIPSRSYRPTVVLISDGIPTDDWIGPLKRLQLSERAAKASRFAMGIGEEADEAMLERFIDNPEQRVFTAADAKEIQRFFKFMTMSVTSRTKSMNPNEPDEVVDFEDEIEDGDY